MGLVLTSPPAAEPVSLQQAKSQLRVSHSDDDLYISGLISVSRDLVEKITHRQILPASYTLTLEKFPDGKNRIELPRAPLLSVQRVDYVNTDGDSTTLATSVYAVDTTTEPGCIYLNANQTWPATEAWNPQAVEIQFQAGYSKSSKIPRTLIQAILVSIAHLYENREPVSVERGLRPERVPGIADLLTLNTVPVVA